MNMKLSKLIENQEILDNRLFYRYDPKEGYCITFTPLRIGVEDEEDLSIQVEIDLDLHEAQEKAATIVRENPLMALDVIQQSNS